MSTKKRKKGTGSIKGFIGLLCLIGIALFLHQTNERGEHFSLETAQEKLETAVDGIQQKISGIQQDTKHPPQPRREAATPPTWKYLLLWRNGMKSS